MRVLIIHLMITVAAALALHGELGPGWDGWAEFGLYSGIFALLWLSSIFYDRLYFKQIYKGVGLALYFTKELLVSNLEIIYYVITPRLQFQPAILKLELRLKSKSGIALLANLITLTPGTLTMDVSSNRKHLYFHTINVPKGDAEAARQKIRNGFEKRILGILG